MIEVGLVEVLKRSSDIQDVKLDLSIVMPPTLKKWGEYCFQLVCLFVRLLAHLSRRLIGELIVYKGIRRPSVVRPSVNIFKRHLL